MSFVTRQVAHCDLCLHEWLPATNKTPTFCAKCKGRLWNGSTRAKTQPSKTVAVLHKSDARHHPSCKCGVCAAQKETR